MTYSDTVATIALAVSILGIIFSGYLSYFFAKKIEKRKEYNAIADKLNPLIEKQKNLVIGNKKPEDIIRYEDFYSMSLVCGGSKGRKILAAHTAYDLAVKKYMGIFGGFFTPSSERIQNKDTIALMSALEALAKLCKRK